MKNTVVNIGKNGNIILRNLEIVLNQKQRLDKK
jgi:hypothetical protein